jgi:hypothetical protein
MSATPGGRALDEPVEPGSGGRYGPDLEPRLSGVENEVRDLKDTQAELKSMVARIEAKLDAFMPHVATKVDLASMGARLDAVLPHRATKADLAATQSDLAKMRIGLETALPYLATKADQTAIQTRLDVTLPYLATRADLADKPGKTYMWGILAALLTAYACGLAALAVLK